MGLWDIVLRPFRRAPRRPLAARRPDRGPARAVPLGMEATNLDLIDKVNRRNDTLERVNQVRMDKKPGGWTAAASTDVAPMPEDETYAARYHRAFQQKGDKT